MNDPSFVQRRAFVAESNRIENIHRGPTVDEIDAHEALWALDELSVDAVSEFVDEIAGAPLREKVGMNVRVGSHLPLAGGPAIYRSLAGILDAINGVDASPYAAHVAYETLHPYMDGNGRSGRAIWAWQMLRDGRDPFGLGFLHTFYYQALQEGRPASTQEER